MQIDSKSMWWKYEYTYISHIHTFEYTNVHWIITCDILTSYKFRKPVSQVSALFNQKSHRQVTPPSDPSRFDEVSDKPDSSDGKFSALGAWREVGLCLGVWWCLNKNPTCNVDSAALFQNPGIMHPSKNCFHHVMSQQTLVASNLTTVAMIFEFGIPEKSLVRVRVGCLGIVPSCQT